MKHFLNKILLFLSLIGVGAFATFTVDRRNLFEYDQTHYYELKNDLMQVLVDKKDGSIVSVRSKKFNGAQMLNNSKISIPCSLSLRKINDQHLSLNSLCHIKLANNDIQITNNQSKNSLSIFKSSVSFQHSGDDLQTMESLLYSDNHSKEIILLDKKSVGSFDRILRAGNPLITFDSEFARTLRSLERLDITFAGKDIVVSSDFKQIVISFEQFDREFMNRHGISQGLGWFSPISKFLLNILDVCFSQINNVYGAFALYMTIYFLLNAYFIYREFERKRNSEAANREIEMLKRYNSNVNMFEIQKKYGLMNLSDILWPLASGVITYYNTRYVLPNSFHFKKSRFLWIDRLGNPDSFNLLRFVGLENIFVLSPLSLMFSVCLYEIISSSTKENNQMWFLKYLVPALLFIFSSKISAGNVIFLLSYSVIKEVLYSLYKRMIERI